MLMPLASGLTDVRMLQGKYWGTLIRKIYCTQSYKRGRLGVLSVWWPVVLSVQCYDETHVVVQADFKWQSLLTLTSGGKKSLNMLFYGRWLSTYRSSAWTRCE